MPSRLYRTSFFVLAVPLATCLAAGWSLSLPAEDVRPSRPKATPKQQQESGVRRGQLPSQSRVVPIGDAKVSEEKQIDKRLVRLRERYKFRSIRDRLNYEQTREAPGTAPKLTQAAKLRLHDAETRDVYMGDARKKSLKALHSAKAREFVSRPGFGVGRMVPEESPMRLPAPKAPRFRLATVPELSADEQRGEVVVLPSERADTGTGGNPLRLPAQSRVEKLHFRSLASFLNPNTFGYVRDRDHVAGFTPHKFLYLPELPEAEKQPVDSKTWRIRRLELVSLLKHETPRVYVSETLPRMDELGDAKTRPLNDVEARHLGNLRDGQDVAIEARRNVIRMLGSLRASKKCMECHSVQRGALLGAFTYELQRDPPLKKEDVPLPPAI